MQISVYVSATLRNFVNRRAKIDIEGSTVREILKHLQREYPESKKTLFEEDGTLRTFISVYVNNVIISKEAELDVPLKEGDQLLLLPVIAGGAPAESLISDERRKEISLGDLEIERFNKHLMLQKIGVKGQKRIMAAKVLIIGLGALGSPVVQYLAAAGVGTIGIVDFDEVSFGNLQSQVIHSTRDIHRPKTASARTYHVGDAVPLEGDSFKYPEYFDIISLENNGVVLIRGGQIQDIIKLQDYYFTGLPVLDERGFALIIKNQKDLEEFLKEYDRTEGKNVSEFHNKWFRFETYRKIVCTDNFWMI